jgi:hypothetical protein
MLLSKDAILGAAVEGSIVMVLVNSSMQHPNGLIITHTEN